MCADRDNLRKLISDLVERRRANGALKDATGMKDMIDAALALNLPDDVMIADLVTFFIGGFHTAAACESSLLEILCCFCYTVTE